MTGSREMQTRPSADPHAAWQGELFDPRRSVLQASDLRPLSVRGRYAYALACVELLCESWGIDVPFVRGQIDAHWGALDAPRACHWLDAHPFPRDEAALGAAVTAPVLSADRLESLYHAFDEARQVIASSCYAAASDGGSMRAVLNVVGVLARWGVAPPPREPFAHATWSGEFLTHGWGDRLGQASFRGGPTPDECPTAPDAGR